MSFYALFKSEKLIGIFDSESAIQNMIDGLVKNKFSSKNKLSIKKYHRNTICEVSSKNNIPVNDNKEDKSTKEIKLSPKDEEKRNKEKSEIEYELLKLKKDKEKINESKKIYDVDLDLYYKFKNIKENNSEFVIPELFAKKYDVFEMIEKEGNLNWENFFANYKQKNLSSSYSEMFDNGDARNN